jgi:hypothetical protein
VKFRSNDPDSVNDRYAITRELGLLPNIAEFGGPAFSDESGIYGSVLRLADRGSKPNIEVLLFGQLSWPQPEQAIVSITDVLEVTLLENQQLSLGQIGCSGPSYPFGNIVAVIPTSSTGGGEVAAIRAWQYTRQGLREVDPRPITCQLVSAP